MGGRHHASADRDGDPHSPWRYGHSVRGLAKGLLFAHIGWMFQRDPTNRDRLAKDLLADPGIGRVDRLSGRWSRPRCCCHPLSACWLPAPGMAR